MLSITSNSEAYLQVLTPCGPLFKGRDVPERQTAREVDDSQQGAVRAQAHAKHTVLTNQDTHIMLKRIFTSFHNLGLILNQAEGQRRAALPFRPLVWKRV